MPRFGDFLFALAQFRDVFVGRDPAAIRNRQIDHIDRTAVGKINCQAVKLPGAIALHQVLDVFVGIAVKRTGYLAVGDQVAQRYAYFRGFRREAIHLHIALVTQQQLAICIEHAKALRHVIERAVELYFLIANSFAVGQRGNRRQRDQRDNQGDDGVVMILRQDKRDVAGR